MTSTRGTLLRGAVARGKLEMGPSTWFHTRALPPTHMAAPAIAALHARAARGVSAELPRGRIRVPIPPGAGMPQWPMFAAKEFAIALEREGDLSTDQ